MAAPAPRSLALWAPAALAGAICTAHFFSFGLVEAPVATDVRYYLYFAWRVAEGGVPHVDFFGNKTQLAAMLGGLLYRLGEAVGTDPLLTIRAGYLAIASAGGLLAYSIHRRIGGDRALAGLVGAVAYCAFPLLAILPTIGNVPKLLMAVLASIMGLCVHRRRWFWAGLCGSVAFMDWQVGGVVGAAALVGALLYRPARWRAAASVSLGGVAGLAPFAAYYASNGALRPWLDQIIVASFLRGSLTLERQTVAERWKLITHLVERAGPVYPALFYLAGAGVLVAAFWLWRKRGSDAGRLLAALSVHHVAVVAFSLVDFQRFGDLFILLHSAAFFLALAWNGAFELFLRLAGNRLGDAARLRAVAGAVFLVGVIALARPGPLAPREPFPFQGMGQKATLSEQREVADQIRETLGDARLVFLEYAEFALLMRHENPLPYIYWNIPTWIDARKEPRETRKDTVKRLILGLDPDAYTLKRRGLPYVGYEAVRFESESGNAGATLFVREGLLSRERPPPLGPRRRKRAD